MANSAFSIFATLSPRPDNPRGDHNDSAELRTGEPAEDAVVVPPALNTRLGQGVVKIFAEGATGRVVEVSIVAERR